MSGIFVGMGKKKKEERRKKKKKKEKKDIRADINEYCSYAQNSP